TWRASPTPAPGGLRWGPRRPPFLPGLSASQGREAGGGPPLAHHDVSLFLPAPFASDGVLEAGDALHRHETSALNRRLNVVARKDFPLRSRAAEVELRPLLRGLDRPRPGLLGDLWPAGTTPADPNRGSRA